jgi:predicted acylesterase/phospholipase RssA
VSGDAISNRRVSGLQERFAEIGPLTSMETQLARAAAAARGALDERDEGALRYALSLCRAWHVRAPDGSDIAIAALLRPFRDRLLPLLWPLLDPQRAQLPTAPQLSTAAPAAAALARAALSEVQARLGEKLPARHLDREVRERHLVLVCGGGGGTGYVHLAAFALLESAGLQPELIAGSSMGAILGLFRARERRFDLARIPEILHDLTYRKIFRIMPQPSVYGLPAPLRLHLRAAVGHWFRHPDGSPVRLCDLPIPLLVTVTGIRRGKLPRPIEEYETMFGIDDADPSLWSLRSLHKNVQRLTTAVAELARIPRLTSRLVFGALDETRSCDAIDAAGFSASVPGVIHYDVLREDPPMHQLLDRLLEQHHLLRLCDGGVVDNVPVRTAWQYVQRTGLRGGSRNAVIFALDAFAPRLLTPLWLPLQTVAAPGVARNRPYAHLYKAFRKTLSPLALLPTERSLAAIVRSAKEELLQELPVLQRLLAPIPALR